MDDDTPIEIMNPMILSDAYDNMFKSVKDKSGYKDGYHQVLHTGLILKDSIREVVRDPERQARSDCCVVNSSHVEHICQYVADGRGVIAVIKAGPRLAELKFGEVYSPTSDHTTNLHAILLIGAIFWKGRIIYIFLNSWGKEFCAFRDVNKNIIIGGIGMVETEFCCNPIVLSRSWEKGNLFIEGNGILKLQLLTNCMYLLGASGQLSVSWRVDLTFAEVNDEIVQLLSPPCGRPTFTTRIHGKKCVQDMGIQEPELVGLIQHLEDLEQKRCSHPLSKSGQSEQEMSNAEFNDENETQQRVKDVGFTGLPAELSDDGVKEDESGAPLS